MKVEIRCFTNSNLDNAPYSLLKGPYSLETLPGESPDRLDAILSFEDERKAHSHPEEEGRIILDVISVLTQAPWSAT